jgi:hypothetical protein
MTQPNGLTNEPENAKHAANNDHKSGDPVLISPENGDSDDQTHRAAERDHWTREQRHNRRVTIFSSVAAVAAVVAASIAGLAYRESHRQANAAWQQARILQEAEHKQLRAYISAKVAPESVKNFVKGQVAELQIGFQNSGQTPALDTLTTAIFYPRPYPLPDTMDLTIRDTPDKTSPGHGITLSPRDENLGSTLTRMIEPDLYEAAIDGKMVRYYAFGIIRYRDIFSVEHWTHFCISFYGEGLKRWDLCPRYNDADHNEE